MSELAPLPPDMTPETYCERLRTIGRVGRHVLFALGDLLLEGERRWGERAAQYAEAAGYAPSTLSNAMWVAAAIPPECRRDALTFHHHAAVAALEPAVRDALLSEAERSAAIGQPMTVPELRVRARNAVERAPRPMRSLWAVGDALAAAALDYIRACQHAEQTPGDDRPDCRDLLAVADEWRIRRTK